MIFLSPGGLKMNNEFQYRLQKALAASGMTASELSEKTGISEANISNYINGKYVAKQDKCFLLARALNVDPGWLMTGDEPKRRNMEEHADGSSPRTPEARILARGIDKMSPAQREAIMNLMSGLYPGLCEKGIDDDET